MKVENNKEGPMVSVYSSAARTLNRVSVSDSGLNHLTTVAPRYTGRRLKSMSSLNDQEQQLLETLLNQADAVSPGTEKSPHEHGGFSTAEHDFQLLDSYINSEMGEDMEPMQFDQQPSNSAYSTQQQGASFHQQTSGSGYGGQQLAPSSGYGGQQLATSSAYGGQQQVGGTGYGTQQPASGYSSQQQPASSAYTQQAPASNPPTPSDANFQSPGSAGFAGQQGGYSSAAAVQSPVQMDQASPADFHVQSPSFNQVQGVAQGQANPSVQKGNAFHGQPSPYQSQQLGSGHAEQMSQSQQYHQSSATDQSFQGSCGQQQQTNTFHSGTAAAQHSHLNTGFSQEQQQTSQFQAATSNQVEQNSGVANFPGHVSKFQGQQSFQSPAGSPCQPDGSVPQSPSSFVQPSPDYGAQPMSNAAGYQSGQMRAFQKQTSFQSPTASPSQPQLDQQPSAAFSSQSQMAYQGAGQSSVGEEQGTGVSYNPQTPTFSPSSHNSTFSPASQPSAFSPAPGEQTAAAGFQGTQSFHQNTPTPADQSVDDYQTQSSGYRRQFSSQGEQNMGGQSQTAGFQQQTFPAQTVGQENHQPMDDGTDHISMEAKAILQETLNSHVQPAAQDKALHEYQSKKSEYQAVQTSQYQAVPTSQYQTASSSQFQAAQTQQYSETSQYQSPFQQTSQYQQVSMSYAQRDQPMEAQSSIVGASVPSPGVFHGFTPSSVQSPSCSAPTTPASASAGDGYLNQAMAYQAQSSGYSVSTFASQSDSSAGQGTIVSSAPSGQFGAASFSQFQTSTTSAFGFSQASHGQPQNGIQQSQFQQAQHMQQQHIQQAGLSQSQHSGAAAMVNNSNSHALASQVNAAIAGENINQPAQFGLRQFSQPAPVGSQTIQPTQVISSGIGMSNNFQGSAQSAGGSVVHVNSSPPLPMNSVSEKSPVASLIDSSQANAALNLLTSLLSNQSLLQGLQSLQALLQPSGQTGGDSNQLSKLLQAHLQRNSQQAAQQVEQGQQQSGNVQPQAQGAQFLQQQPVQSGTNQQPNFLLQQQLPQTVQTFSAQQQLPAPSQQQQQSVQIPAASVGSLDNLGALGITVGSDGQLMMGQQGLKIFLQTGTVTSTASSSAITQAHPINVQSLSSQPVAFTTTVTPSGHTVQPVSPLKLAAGFSLPSDLQNISVLPLCSAATSSNGNVAVPSTTSVTVASISLNTTVTPSSSFIHPVPAAGVGGSVPGVTSASGSTADTFTFLSSHPNVPVAQNSHSLGAAVSSSEVTPSVANIFYPTSTSPAYSKPAAEASQAPSVSVKNFLNVTTGSASSLLKAFKMAVNDGNSTGFSTAAVSSTESIFTTARPMDTGQGDAKLEPAHMDVGEAVVSSNSTRPMDMDGGVLDLGSRHSSRKSSLEDDAQKAENSSMLRRILTMKDDDTVDPPAAAEMLLESPTSASSPVDLNDNTHQEMFIDGNTQATLIEQSQKLQLGSDAQNDDEIQDKLWAFPSGPSSPVDEVVPSKVHKGLDDLDASSVHISAPSVEKLFDAGGAASCSSFVFTKFGADVPNSVFTFGNSQTATAETTATETKPSSFVAKSDAIKPLTLPTASIRPSSRKQKDPSLTCQFPSKVGEYELRILTQPEEQHRARYLTEGSRGAVKDRSQQGYPIIKLLGYDEPTTLQIFIGNEAGRVKPHGFYQACKVCGKNSTQCSERDIDGTNVIEIDMSPVNDMQVSMDCVGILKLRNADVEKRIGPSKAKAHKKNSTKARLVFRVCVRKPDGSCLTLQTVSSPILCTQPIGQPEISRMSLSELCVNRTSDLFIIGKNFLKGTQILFQELGPDGVEVLWQSEAEIEAEFFQQTHLICRIPSYHRKDIDRPVHVQIIAVSGGKTSDPQEFMYMPAMVMVKEEDPMETESCPVSKSLPFPVSPVALQLNRLVERTQHHLTSTSLFQLPPGAVPSIPASSGTHLSSAPKLVASGAAHTVSSVLKPATLTVPIASQPVPPAPSGNGQENSVPRPTSGTVPLQFVLPNLGSGQAVTLDSHVRESSLSASACLPEHSMYCDYYSQNSSPAELLHCLYPPQDCYISSPRLVPVCMTATNTTTTTMYCHAVYGAAPGQHTLQDARRQQAIAQAQVSQAERLVKRIPMDKKPGVRGDNVTIPIPTSDRGRGDARNILGVILERDLDSDLYTIAVRAGVLKDKYSRSQFDICPLRLMKLQDINQEKTVSLRAAVIAQSSTGCAAYTKGSCAGPKKSQASQSQTPRLLLMNPAVSLASSTSPSSRSVFSLNGLSATAGGIPAVSLPSSVAVSTPQPVSGQPGSSSPMIIVFTGPPASATPGVGNNSTSGSGSGSSQNSNGNGHFIPLTVQQPATSGQVESLLKQILEASKPSSS